MADENEPNEEALSPDEFMERIQAEQIEDEPEQDDEPEEQPAEQPEEPDPSIEAEARKHGWRPETEWRGDRSGWVPAERFMELPSTQLKIIREDRKRERAEYDDRLSRIEQANRAAMDRAIEAQKQQHQRELDTIRAQKRSAVEVGDTKEFERLEGREDELRKAEPAPPEPQKPQVDPWLNEYRNSEQGKWINDPTLFATARQVIDAAGPSILGKPAREQVEYAESQLRRLHPHLFETGEEEPKPRRTAKVDPGGLAGPRRSGKGFKDLPAEAKRVAKDLQFNGYVQDLEQYAKDYFEEAS